MPKASSPGAPIQKNPSPSRFILIIRSSTQRVLTIKSWIRTWSAGSNRGVAWTSAWKAILAREES
jgi:hypothetical protein